MSCPRGGLRKWLGVLVAVLAAGCTTDTVTTPTTDQLAGSWALVSIQPAGKAEQPTPAGVSYAVTFAAGRVTARADCNTCSGVFALSGSTLSAGPTLICTRAACPTMAFENTFTLLLAGDSTVGMSGSKLTLTSPRGVLRFTR
jgi:heat shock protein HslJ